MEIDVAEQLTQHRRPLHEQADVMLVGHAYPAMHLNAFAGGEPGDVGRLGFGDGDEELGLFVA